MRIQEIRFKLFPLKSDLASYKIFKWCPAVWKNQDGTYGMRIIVGKSRRGDSTVYNWDNFDLDSTGLVTQSPRGMAKMYNKRLRITDMDEAVEEYKDKKVNED